MDKGIGYSAQGSDRGCVFLLYTRGSALAVSQNSGLLPAKAYVV